MSKIRLVPGGSDEALFNQRPIKLDGFELRQTAAVAIGTPSLKEWQAAFELASASSESSPYWVGDLLGYAESRAEWKERLDQAMSYTGLSRQRLIDLGYLCRHVEPDVRALAPSVEHARAVAPLPPKEQRRWLRQATTEGWTRRDMKLEMQAAQKRGVVRGTAELEGMFRVWLVDFPWRYRQAQPSGVTAESRYQGMTLAEGMKMADAVKAHTLKHAVLFFWVTAPMLYHATDPAQGPDPYRLIRSWGFEAKTGGVWDKVEHNFGHYLSIRHEHLLIAVRGSCTPDRPIPMLDSIFVERKSDVHSEKPKTAFTYIERLYDGPYVELFAREERAGWTTWGNQVGELIVKRAEKAG